MFKDYIDKHPELGPKTIKKENEKNETTRIRVGGFDGFQLTKIIIEFGKTMIILGREQGMSATIGYFIAKAGEVINEKALLRSSAHVINFFLSGMSESQPSIIAGIREGKGFENYKVPAIPLYDLYTEVCNESFQHLFYYILKNTDITYEKKLYESGLTLQGTLDGVLESKEKNSLARCIVTILQQLSSAESTTGFTVLLEMFTAAIEAEKIPQDIGVLVAKKLRESNIPISSTLQLLLNNPNKSNFQAIAAIPRGGSSKGSSRFLITTIQKKRFYRIRKKLKSIRVGPLISDKGSLIAGLGVEILLLLSSNGKIDSYLETKRDSIPNVERQVGQNNSSILDSKLQSEENSEKISKSEKSEKPNQPKKVVSQADIEKEMKTQELGDEEKPTPVKPKTSRKRRVKHRRARMVTLNDLEPLKDEDFPDVCEPKCEPNNRNQRSIREGRIRNK